MLSQASAGMINEQAELASNGMATLNPDERKIVWLLHVLSSPEVSTYVMAVFVFLLVAVAYVICGIVLFVLFARR